MGMNGFGRVRSYASGLILTGQLLSSCYGPSMLSAGYGDRNAYAMKELGVGSSMLVFLPDGYITSTSAQATLRIVAGVEAGTVNVVKTRQGCMATGSYSQALHPEAMTKACADSDVNGDKVVTWEEATSHVMEVYRDRCR